MGYRSSRTTLDKIGHANIRGLCCTGVLQGQVFLETPTNAAFGEVPRRVSRCRTLTILRLCHYVCGQGGRVVTTQTGCHIVGGSGRVLPTVQVVKIIVAGVGGDVMKVTTIGATTGDLIEQWIDKADVEATLLHGLFVSHCHHGCPHGCGCRGATDAIESRLSTTSC